jgi:hypothetical protein
MPAFDDLRAREAEAEEETTTLESASIVSAVIAAFAGLRPGICMMLVPSLIFDVFAPIQASGEMASEPHASAVHTES